jgi:hypothetical protein
VQSGAPARQLCEGGASPERWRSMKAAVPVGCGIGRWRGRRVVAGGDDGVALQHRGVKGEVKTIPKWKDTKLWWCSLESRKTAVLGSETG